MTRVTLAAVLTLAFLATCIFSAPAAVSAQTAAFEPPYIAKFVVGQKAYEVRGEVRQMDVAPFIENGRTFVPVRFLAYAIGVPENGVSWENKTQTVRLENRGIAVTLRVRERVLRRNGSPVQMDVAPVLRQNRVFLPARFVAEAFGCGVAWDQWSKSVCVYPVKIDWEAAKKGTLQPPENAKQPPDEWGFPAKAVRMEFKVGSRYAKVTRPDGSTYQLDLGTPCVVVTAKEDVDWLKSNYPSVYKPGTYVIVDDPKKEYWAVYVPFIPVAEAFGVPRENIIWDGQHLAVFGYYGDVRNYRVLTPGTKESVCRVVGNNPEVASGSLNFPLFVKDGVPMVGINSVSDIAGMLFSVAGGSVPNLINAYDDIYFGGWEYENGTAGASCEPRA
jgi:hypothetical protein